MKKNWWFALVGIALWSITYLTFTVDALNGSLFLSLFPQTLFILLFLFFIPGLIISLLFYEIGGIKKTKERRQSFWIEFVILVVFFIFYKLKYLQ